MAAWPSYAKILAAGYRENPRPGVKRTPMESGPPKQRVADSRVLRQVSVTAVMATNADWQSFLTWWETTISRVGWFDWTDPSSGTLVQARIVGGQIAGDPRNGALTGWRVSLTLEHWNA